MSFTKARALPPVSMIPHVNVLIALLHHLRDIHGETND
jgi:hypothetical protein